jgi:RNase P protein component
MQVKSVANAVRSNRIPRTGGHILRSGVHIAKKTGVIIVAEKTWMPSVSRYRFYPYEQ